MIRKCCLILIHWLLWLCIITNLFILNLERVVEHCYKLCAASIFSCKKRLIQHAACIIHWICFFNDFVHFVAVEYQLNELIWLKACTKLRCNSLDSHFYVMINLDMFSEEARFELLLSYVLLTTKPRSFIIKQWYIDKITATNVATETLVLIS